MNTTTLAGAAGRTLRQIDWSEVAALVIDCLTALAILTLLAGRATRRAWDALPVLSEALGRWYSGWLVGKPESHPQGIHGQEAHQGAAEGDQGHARVQGRQPAHRQARARKGAQGDQPQAGRRHRAQRGRKGRATASRTVIKPALAC